MIKAFSVNIGQEKLDDLKYRLERTRWPDEIENSGWNYGANLGYMKELHQYWLTQFNWRGTENEINRYKNFIADIDGHEIHFIHEKGSGKKSVPIIITHGWPGSFLEMMKLIPLLTRDPEVTFDVVIPSMPGYGFSSKPVREGCNVGFMADLWVKLMDELGYGKFAVQGGDFGAGVSAALAFKYPERIIGMHLNYIPGNYFPEPDNEAFSEEEKEYLKSEEEWYFKEGGYSLQQKTKPITLAYGLNDSPMGLCAWIVEKMYGWADCRQNIESVFSKDELLSNVTLYWLTETIHSSIRLYGENSRYPLRIKENSPLKTPLGIARFAYEEPFPPRRYIERGFNIRHWTDFPDGGHFPAIEKPLELAHDIKTFFRKIHTPESGQEIHLTSTTSGDRQAESSYDTGSQRFYHGTKAGLNPGDLIEPGFNSNYGKKKIASYVYLTATLDAAVWGAELALGEGAGRIYIVEPTGPIEDDPNLTDKKFPGNPTRSYRSRSPLRVTGEVRDWQGHSPEQLNAMKEHLERLKQLGIEAIED